MIRKIGKWVFRISVISIQILVLLLMVLAHSIEFTYSDEELDAMFADAGVDVRQSDFEFGGRKIHYVEAGSSERPKVLFLHGSPGSWTNWKGYFKEKDLLGAAHLIAPDRPGFGGSGPNKAEPSLQKQADAMVEVLRHVEDPGKAILVGYSLGGPLAVKIAQEYPEWVESIVLVAPSIDPELEETKWIQYPATWKAVNWIVPDFALNSNREIMPLKVELEAMLPKYKDITVPVSMLQGTSDQLVPKENADFAEEWFVNAPLKVERIPNTTHEIVWTQHEKVAETLRTHLDMVKRDSIAIE